VGGTPLVELRNIAQGLQPPNGGARLFAKAEFMNPSGSVKDRAVRAMLLDGIARGLLTREKTIIDATSGNSGIAYAMFGASLGYRVKLFMPSNSSPERKRIITSYGAEIVPTDPLEGADGAFLAVRDAVARDARQYYYADQYNNPANPEAHYSGTGGEIWKQSAGSVTHFISGMGTSGTFMGVSRRLKTENPAIRTVAVQPASPLHGIEGTKHMASALKPGILDESIEDGVIAVTTEEAYAMTRRLAREEGLFVGISSGANVAAALRLAETLDRNAVLVTILCDNGSRYMSDSFWENTVSGDGDKI
jgi:cysteine synthase B